MVSKRKQARKIKREVKRRVMRGRAQNKAQNSSIPKEQETMLKLMAMLKGGGGTGTGQNMDAATVLKLREEAAAKTNENARLKREAREVEAQAKADEKQAKGEFEVAQERRKAEVAKMQRQHKGEVLKHRGEAQALDGEQRLLDQQLANLNHQLEVNNLLGSIEEKRVAVQKLKRKKNEIINSLDYKTGSPKIRDSITRAVNSIDSTFKEIDVIFDLINKQKARDVELQSLETLINEVKTNLHDLITHQADIKHRTELIKNDIHVKNDYISNYRNIKKDIADQELQLEMLREQQKFADHKPEFEQDGSVKMKYREPLRDETPPADTAVVKRCREEATEILEYLVNLSEKFTTNHWDELLTQDIYTNGADQKVIDSLEGRINWKSKRTGKTFTKFVDLQKYYNDIVGEYIEAMRQATEEYQANKKFNDELRSNQIISTKQITQQDLIDANKRKQERERELEALEHDISEKRQLKGEYMKVQRELERLNAKIAAIPKYETGETTIQALSELDQQREHLERQLSIKEQEMRRIQALEDKNADLTFENKISKEKLKPNSLDEDRMRSEQAAIEAQVMAQRQKEIQANTEQTYKAERERRMAEHAVNVQNSQSVQKLHEQNEKLIQDRISREAETKALELQQKGIEEAHKAQTELRTQKEIMKAYTDQVRHVDAGTVLTVLADETTRQAQEFQAERERARAAVRKYMPRFHEDPGRLEDFNTYLTLHNLRPVDSIEQIENIIRTDSAVGVMERYFAGPPPQDKE